MTRSTRHIASRAAVLLALALLVATAIVVLGSLDVQATTPATDTTDVILPYSATHSVDGSIGQAYAFDARWGDVVEIRATPLGDSEIEVALVGLPYGDDGGHAAGTSVQPASITHRIEQSGVWQVRVGRTSGSQAQLAYSISIWLSTQGATTSTTLYQATFSDIPASHEYVNEINDLAARGIVAGYPDSAFRPDAPLERQQFAKLIVKTLGYPVSEADACPFTDVALGTEPDPLYPDNYVAVCAARGITIGTTAWSFAPYDSITREQLITMLVRATRLPAAPDGYVPRFGLGGLFSTDEHRANAVKAYYAGLMDRLYPGKTYSFTRAASRAEGCVMLYNLLLRSAGVSATPTAQP